MEIKQVIPRDAIPSVDDPAFGEEYFGKGCDRAIVVEPTTAPARAYPVRILQYHEIVNDRVEGDPIAVTWCPLCGSGIVYDRGIDGQTLTFGVSGKLADDDLVMYDRETGSEWKQSSGICIDGQFAGRQLPIRTAAMMRLDRFRDRYPTGTILQPPGGKSEASGPSDEPQPIDYTATPYQSYFDSDGFGLATHRGEDGRDWDRDDVDPKEPVLGFEMQDEALAVPRSVVAATGGVRTVTVGGQAVLVLDDGAELQAFQDPGYSFHPTDEPGTYRADGTTWDATSGKSADGRSLERIPGRRLFAFAWQDDHGPDSFLTERGVDDG
ncbi:MAG: DUF3179 domain-containing protein [Halobacteriales archaeon]